MGLRIISFTERGMRLSEKLAGLWEDGEAAAYTKWSAAKTGKPENAVRFVEERVTEWAGRQMDGGHILLFIGACGIAVRAIAPWVQDKLHDSPVLVMDERAAYIIPILSGHVGGANRIAERIAEKMGAIPVITTATDVNGAFAVDLFAVTNGLYIANRDGIAKVSAKALAGGEITLSVESGHIRKEIGVPAGIRILSYPPEGYADVVITGEEREFETALLLRPREYVIGMGCRKGKEAEKIEELIDRSLKKAGILRRQILALASIDRKKEEAGLAACSRKAGIPFYTYTAEQLEETAGSLHGSAFVKRQVGVDNVCERAALRACGCEGILVYEKHAKDGMTIAIARREWHIVFDREAEER